MGQRCIYRTLPVVHRICRQPHQNLKYRIYFCSIRHLPRNKHAFQMWEGSENAIHANDLFLNSFVVVCSILVSSLGCLQHLTQPLPFSRVPSVCTKGKSSHQLAHVSPALCACKLKFAQLTEANYPASPNFNFSRSLVFRQRHNSA